MKSGLRKLFAAGVVVTALVLAACAPAAESPGTTGTTTTPTTPGTGTGAPGGGLVLPAASQPTTGAPAMEGVPASVSGIPLDPNAKRGGVLHITSGVNNQWLVWEQCCASSFHTPLSDGIVRYRSWGTVEDAIAGAFNQVVPDLAYGWEQSPDGMQWTFHLRDGVAFHDGHPFTCEDAAWSLDTNRTGKDMLSSPRGAHIAPIKSISCADDHTLVIEMRRPKPALLEMLALPEFIVAPKHIYESNLGLAREKPVVGTGPFIAREVLPGEKTTYVRNPNYWDDPFPYLDGIELVVNTNTQSQVAAIRAGRTDVFANQSGATIKTVEQECTVCYSFPWISNTGQTFAILPNFERYPWNTPEVRTALSLAIDRRAQMELAYQGSGTLPTGGLFLPGSGWEIPYERVKQIPGYDLERPRAEAVAEAKALLASVGFKPGDLKFAFPLSSGSLNYVRYGIPMVDQLQEAGFVVNVQEIDRTPYYEMMESGNFDVGGHAGYFRGVDPDGHFYEFFYPGSDRNYGRYSNPEAKRLIDLQSQTLDQARRKEIAWDAAELILRDVVRVFTGFSADRTFFNKRVHNVMPGPVAMSGHWQQHRHTWVE